MWIRAEARQVGKCVKKCANSGDFSHATLRFQTRALRFRLHARVQNGHRSSRFAWGNRGFSVGVGAVGFFGPKTAAEKMCKIPAVSRALKKCAYSGRIFRCPRRSGVGIRCFGGRRLCMGTRNGGFVTPATPTLVSGFEKSLPTPPASHKVLLLWAPVMRRCETLY